MARNGSGTYTVPNSFTAGAVITASDHNENWSDVGSEVTNSVAADGQTSMTGPLKASSGTAAAPAVTFASDTDSGVYRVGSDNLGVAVGGTKIVDVASTGATITGAIDATVVKQGTYRLLPAGVIVPYGGSAAPDGWLLCYGQDVSRTTYADLFTALSTTYGVGDGSTTFTLPDLRGRVVAGQDDMGGSSANRLTGLSGGVNGDTLGASGGAETHTLTAAESATLTYTSAVTDPGHIHSHPNSATSAERWTGIGGGASVTTANTSSATTGVTVATTSDAGGGAHNNMQPTIILNYIVKY